MLLHIVRHCRTDYNDQGRCQGTTDIPLNSQGRLEATALGKRFDAMEIDAVYASPYTRAMETAKGILGERKLDIITDPGLSELDQGDLEGLDMNEMTARFPGLIKEWFHNPADTEMPGGSETMRMVQDRAWKVIESISARHSSAGHVIAVSHNLTICMIICRVLNLPISEFRRFKLLTSGITTVSFNSRWPVITRVNDTAHLD